MTDETGNVDTLEAPLAIETESHHGARSRDRVIGGVAGSLAERLDLNPMWVRLFFVVLALVGGVGVVVYAGLWLVLPDADASPYRRPLGTVVLVVGLPLTLVLSGVPTASGPLAIVGLLAGIALLLWQPPMPVRTRTGDPATIQIGPLAEREESITSGDDGEDEVGTPTASTRFVRRVRRERRSSLLGRVTLGLALSAAALGALIDANNGGRLHPEQWLGLATVVCGTGLVVGTARGYARWLIVPAIGFATAGVVGGQLARFDVPIGQAFGDRYLRVEAASTVTDYRLDRGYADGYIAIEDDLTRDVVVDATIISGTLTVEIPTGTRVELDALTPHGSISSAAASTTMDGDTMVIGPSEAHTVHINARVEHGDVIVTNWKPWVEPDPTEPVSQLGESDGQPWDVQRTRISDQIEVTANGYVILLSGQVVIGPDNQIVQAMNEVSQQGSVTRLYTDAGEYRLTRGILIDPYAQLWDLDAIRASLSTTHDAPVSSIAPATPVGSVTAPIAPTTVPGTSPTGGLGTTLPPQAMTTPATTP